MEKNQLLNLKKVSWWMYNSLGKDRHDLEDYGPISTFSQVHYVITIKPFTCHQPSMYLSSFSSTVIESPIWKVISSSFSAMKSWIAYTMFSDIVKVLQGMSRGGDAVQRQDKIKWEERKVIQVSKREK